MTDRILRKLIERLSDSPTFLALALNQYRVRQNQTWDDLAAELGLTPDQIGRLALCRPPRRETFAGDVRKIAEAIPMSAPLLANFLRQIGALQIYDAGGESQMAARDHNDEPE